jgi:hypothetical protein
MLTSACHDADLRVEKVRFEAIKRMTKAYRPHLHVSKVARILGFGQEMCSSAEVTPVELEECEEWLTSHGATVITDKGELLVDSKVRHTLRSGRS